MRVSLPYDRPISANVRLGRGILPGLGAFLLLVYPVLVLLLGCISLLFQPRTGLLAVARLFAPHLYLPLLLLLPFALRRGSTGVAALRVALLLCLCMFCLRYLPTLSAAAPVADPAAPKLSVLTWNVFSGNRSATAIDDALLANPADVVVLQEADWLWLDTTGSSAYTVVSLQADAHRWLTARHGPRKQVPHSRQRRFRRSPRPVGHTAPTMGPHRSGTAML